MVEVKSEEKYLNLVGSMVNLQRLENGGIQATLLINPRGYPPKLEGEADDVWRERCGKVLEQVNAYNMLVWRGLRFDDVVVSQEVLE